MDLPARGGCQISVPPGIAGDYALNEFEKKMLLFLGLMSPVRTDRSHAHLGLKRRLFSSLPDSTQELSQKRGRIKNCKCAQ